MTPEFQALDDAVKAQAAAISELNVTIDGLVASWHAHDPTAEQIADVTGRIANNTAGLVAAKARIDALLA